VHEGTVVEVFDKGAVVALPYGVEGFVTPKHLVKEDGMIAKVDEKLMFKVIEFINQPKRLLFPTAGYMKMKRNLPKHQ